MTNEQTKAKELAELLNAFSSEKELLYKNSNDYWERFNGKTVADVFKLADRLRIKPETEQIALTQQDLIDRELRKETISVIYNKTVSHILRYSDSSIYFSEKEIRGYEYLMDFTFLDGTPCYKEVESE